MWRNERPGESGEKEEPTVDDLFRALKVIKWLVLWCILSGIIHSCHIQRTLTQLVTDMAKITGG
jgi:hypothetical protein